MDNRNKGNHLSLVPDVPGLPVKDKTPQVAAISGPTPYSTFMLKGIQTMHNMYAGTVDPVTVQERRVRNKAARKARRLNRK